MDRSSQKNEMTQESTEISAEQLINQAINLHLQVIFHKQQNYINS